MGSVVGIVMIAAINQRGDIWDGLRHRSFGFPLFSLLAGLAWSHLNHRSAHLLDLLLLASLLGNLLLLALYVYKWGYFNGLWQLCSAAIALMVGAVYVVYQRNMTVRQPDALRRAP